MLSSLVSVAAVGRTLGVHMILATQRPAGVVNEDILANTNLRVALRVQSRDDSINVVGVPTAAAIGRTQMGPRLREARSGRHHARADRPGHRPLRGAVLDARRRAPGRPSARTASGVRPGPPTTTHPTDLDLLIDAIVAANDDAGLRAAASRSGPSRWGSASSSPRPAGPSQRRPAGRGPGGRGSSVQVALADDPDGQRQLPAGWDLERGNLLLMGIPGSGTSTTLASLALTLAAELPARGPRPAGARPGLARSRAAGRPAAHRGVRRLRRGRARAAGAPAEVRAGRARPAPGRTRAAPPDGRPDRRPGRAQGRVRRLRGPQAARGALPGVLRRARRSGCGAPRPRRGPRPCRPRSTR